MLIIIGYCFNGFVVVGASTAAYFLLKLVSKFYRLLRVYAWNTSPNLAKYGKWSVVTGSTDGIGKEIAFQLASKGQNIVLIARNTEKLKNVAKEIKSRFNVQVKTLKVDFSDDENIYENIDAFLHDIDIGVLVNNVGLNSPFLDFLDIPDLSKHIQDITRVNMVSMIKMHQIVLPGMVARKRGLILNISSTTALKPMFSIYGASKSFVDYFSQTLSFEYEDKGVEIQTFSPDLVKTNLTKGVPDVPYMVEPGYYAKSLMFWIGKEKRCHGCPHHEVVGWIIRNIPLRLFVWICKRSKIADAERKKNA